MKLNLTSISYGRTPSKPQNRNLNPVVLLGTYLGMRPELKKVLDINLILKKQLKNGNFRG
jgi:hypothetical protein